jgi:hypothetical protein
MAGYEFRSLSIFQADCAIVVLEPSARVEPQGRLWQRPSRLLLIHTGTDRPTRLSTGAGDETRTRDLLLGKQTLYQLSYSRICGG